jgi:hypothetical protein
MTRAGEFNGCGYKNPPAEAANEGHAKRRSGRQQISQNVTARVPLLFAPRLLDSAVPL